MAYPATKTTFSDPAGTSLLTSPDHAVLHTSVNDTVEAIQDTAGTTLGTNIFKNFADGDFPVRATGGGVKGTLQQTITGGTLGTNTLLGPVGTINPQVGTIGTINSNLGTIGTINSNIGTIGTIAGNTGTIGTLIPGTVTTVNSIPGSALSTNANFLGITNLSGTQTITSPGVETTLTGGTLAVTVPSGNRRVKVTSSLVNLVNNTGSQFHVLNIKEGAGTLNAVTVGNAVLASFGVTVTAMWCGTASAGAHTYTVTLTSGASGTTLVNNTATQYGFILAELV